MARCSLLLVLRLRRLHALLLLLLRPRVHRAQVDDGVARAVNAARPTARAHGGGAAERAALAQRAGNVPRTQRAAGLSIAKPPTKTLVVKAVRARQPDLAVAGAFHSDRLF